MGFCEHCHRTGYHLGGCPNAEDEQRAFTCDECGEAIYEGDKVYLLKDFVFCERCVRVSCETASLE